MSTSFSDSSSETSVSEARQEDTPRIHLLHETWRSERQYEMDYMTLHVRVPAPVGLHYKMGDTRLS